VKSKTQLRTSPAPYEHPSMWILRDRALSAKARRKGIGPFVTFSCIRVAKAGIFSSVIHLAFDHEKLMMVTREFAREHGLTLPDGYRRDPGDERDGKIGVPVARREKVGTPTGLSKDERMVMVTAAWEQSDRGMTICRRSLST
jgi:hypothetical protein